MIYAPGNWTPVEISEEKDATEAAMCGRPISITAMSDTEVTLEWKDWIDKGKSGSGIYVDGKLLAVLSRIKRGEYAVGVLVAPYATQD